MTTTVYYSDYIKYRFVLFTVGIVVCLAFTILGAPAWSGAMEQAYAVISPQTSVDTEESGRTSSTGTQHPVIPLTLSPAEKEWYKKFYHGVFFFDGWKEISESILAHLPPEEEKIQKDFVNQLGIKIGTEWSRNNDSRRIDTSMLRGWGKQLRNAAKESPVRLSQVLKTINSEVDKVLRQ